jgi:hypothetical protein
MGLEQLRVPEEIDPFERGPRAYFSGTGKRRAKSEGFPIEAAPFEVNEKDPLISFFSHPWLGEFRIEQTHCILTLSERLNGSLVRVHFHDKGTVEEEQASEKSSVIFYAGQPRIPLVYYPTQYASLHVDITTDLTKKNSFFICGLTERVQRSFVLRIYICPRISLRYNLVCARTWCFDVG